MPRGASKKSWAQKLRTENVSPSEGGCSAACEEPPRSIASDPRSWLCGTNKEMLSEDEGDGRRRGESRLLGASLLALYW